MTAREKLLWEQAIRVLRQNSVTTNVPIVAPKAEQVLAGARNRTITRVGR